MICGTRSSSPLLFVALVVVVLVAGCNRGDSVDRPMSSDADGVPAPPPASTIAESGGAVGFERALRDLDRSLATGSTAAIVSRLLTVQYTCKPEDLSPKLDTPPCSIVGQTIQSILLSRWRSEGALVPVDRVLQLLATLEANVLPAKSDSYGEGRLKVFAFDSSRASAVITAISQCLPNFSCQDGSMRVVLVPRFEFVGERWAISGMLTVYVEPVEFLDPRAEARSVLPGWQRLR